MIKLFPIIPGESALDFITAYRLCLSSKAFSAATAHTIQHILYYWFYAVSSHANEVVSVSVTSSRTSVCLILTRNHTMDVKDQLTKCIRWAIQLSKVPGAHPDSCTNYKSHNLEDAKVVLTLYLRNLNNFDEEYYHKVYNKANRI